MKKKLIKIYLFVLIMILIFHSSITVLYNFPTTPFKLQFDKYVNAYMNPLFQQTWTLFAPTPVNTNNNLQVRVEYYENNTLKESNWISLSDKFNNETQQSYFHPYRQYSSILTQLESSTIKALINAYEKESYENIDAKEFLQLNPGAQILYDFAYYNIREEFINIKSIQLRYVIEYFPEYASSSEKSEYDIIKFPLLNDIPERRLSYFDD